MGTNLPPGVTNADIDKHFGESPTRTVHGTVEVSVTIETRNYQTDQEIKKQLLDAVRNGDFEQAIHARIEEVLDG